MMAIVTSSQKVTFNRWKQVSAHVQRHILAWAEQVGVEVTDMKARDVSVRIIPGHDDSQGLALSWL